MDLGKCSKADGIVVQNCIECLWRYVVVLKVPIKSGLN